MIINNNNLICICILIGLFVIFNCNIIKLSGGNQIGDVKRRISRMKETVNTNLKEVKYDVNKYYYNKDIYSIIKNDLIKFKDFASFQAFKPIFNSYADKSRLARSVPDDQLLIELIVKLINFRHYYVIQHFILKVLLHLSNVNNKPFSFTFESSQNIGGSINTQLDILNNKDFYKYYFDITEGQSNMLSNTKYSFNRLILTDQTLEYKNVLKYPSCWGAKPTSAADITNWETINKFLDQVFLYLNRYVDFNKGIEMSNELIVSLEVIKEIIGNNKTDEEKFTLLRNLILKQLIDFIRNNSFSLNDILNNDIKIDNMNIQNILKLKNNKDIIKNILEFTQNTLSKEKVRNYFKIPNNLIPQTLSDNINKFGNYVKYNKIYTKIVLTDPLQNSIKTYLTTLITQDEYNYDIEDNNIIFDNIFDKLKNKSHIEEEPHIYDYLHFIYNNDLSNDDGKGMNEVINKIESNDLSDDKKEIINKVINKDKKDDDDSDKKKYYDYINNSETYDLITNIINSKHHKLTKDSSSFKVDILTRKELSELFFNHIKNGKLTVYPKTEYPQYFNTYKTNNTDIGFELTFDVVQANTSNILKITWPSYDKLPLKLHYFYIDNILFFINSMDEEEITDGANKPITQININYIYYEENLIEYLERSSLDNQELTRQNAASRQIIEPPSIEDVVQHIIDSSIGIPNNNLLSIKRTNAISKLGNIYKSPLVGGRTKKKEPNYLINNMYKRLATYDKTQKKYIIDVAQLKSLGNQNSQGQWRPWASLEDTYDNKIKFKFDDTGNINLMDNLIEKITDFSIFNSENNYLIKVSENSKLYNENYDILYESYNDKVINSYKYNDENILITGIKKLHDGFEFYVTNIYEKISSQQLEDNLSSIKNNKFIIDEEINNINEKLKDNSMEILDKINLTSRQIENIKKKEYYNTKLDIYKKSPINFINNYDKTISYGKFTISLYTEITSDQIENKLEEFTGGQIDTFNLKWGFMKEINKVLKKYYKKKVVKLPPQGADSSNVIPIELEEWNNMTPKLEMNNAVKFKLKNLEYIKIQLINLIKEKLTNELLKISNKITDTTNKWYTNVRLTIERLFTFIDNIQTSLYKSISLKNPSYFNYNNFKNELNKKQITLSFEYDTNFLNKLFNNILSIPPKNTDILSDKLLNSLLFDTTNIVQKLNDLKKEINIDLKNELVGREKITDEIVKTLIFEIPESPIYTGGLPEPEWERRDLIEKYTPSVLNYVILDKPFMKLFKIKKINVIIPETLVLKDNTRIPTSPPMTGGNNMEYVCINNDCDKLVEKLDLVNLKNNKKFKVEIDKDKNEPVKIDLKPYIINFFDIDISEEAQILSSFDWRELGFSNKKIELINNLVLEKFPNFLKKEQKNIPPLENNKWKGKSILKKEVGIIKNTTYSTSLTTSLTLKIVKFYEFLQKQRLKLINRFLNKLGITSKSFQDIGNEAFFPPEAIANGLAVGLYPSKYTNNISIINLKRDSENEIKSSLKDKFKTYFIDKSKYTIRTYPLRSNEQSSMKHSMMYLKHFVNDNYHELIKDNTIEIQDFIDIFKQTNIIPIDSIVLTDIETILEQTTTGGKKISLNNDLICKIYKSLKKKFVDNNDYGSSVLDIINILYKNDKNLEIKLLHNIDNELTQLSFKNKITNKNIINIIKKHVKSDNINLDNCN